MATVTLTPTPKTGVIAASDPLAYLQEPTVGSCAHTSFSLNGNNGSSGSPYQLYAGTYCGGISVNGNSWLHFNAGTYVLAGGGMIINGNSTMTGTGHYLLQHDRDGRLRRDYTQRQFAGEFQRTDVGLAGGNPVFSGSLDPEHRRGQHDKRKFEFDLRRGALLPDDSGHLQWQQQRQRLQHRSGGQAGDKWQRGNRQQLLVARGRLADKRRGAGRMSTLRTSSRTRRRREQCWHGQASVELALSVPLLLMMFLVVVETGRAFYIAISLSNAARAGVQYGSQNLTTAGDNAGMQAAAANDAPNLVAMTATATHFCVCSDGSRVDVPGDRLRREPSIVVHGSEYQRVVQAVDLIHGNSAADHGARQSHHARRPIK